MSVSALPRKSLNEIPGPPGLPLIGNLLEVDVTKLHLCVEDWCNEYGPIFKFRMGKEWLVCVADVKVIGKILRERPDTFRRRRVFESVMGEMGVNGVFSAEGDNWRRQRRIVAQALNTAHLHRFYPTLYTFTERLLRRWERAADEGRPITLTRELMRYTVDITSKLAFGVDVNTIETDGPVIQLQLDKIFPMLNRRCNAPIAYWRVFRLARDRELDRALAVVREKILEIISTCRGRMERQPELCREPSNFLEAMIAAKEEDGADFSDADIYANVLTLLLAGEDTTANTIAWSVKHFIDYPELFERARAEVDAVSAPAAIPEIYEQAQRLKYIEAFANETMRLKPVAPINPVTCNRDVELMGYQVPVGTTVILLTRHASTSPENFGQPTVFDPERWLEDGKQHGGPHNTSAFMPFGAGPRFCPGRNLALLEVKAVLGMLCRNFDLRLADSSTPVEERLAFTMTPANLDVVLSRRR